MICRLWRGWTTLANAAAYETIVRSEVIPAIEARGIAGFRHIDLMRRDLGDEVEFQTLMWFDDSAQSGISLARIMPSAMSRCTPKQRSRVSTSAPPISKCSTGGRSRR